MNDREAFFLAEAQFTLYPTDADGNVIGASLWFGGFLNKLRATMDFEEVKLRASGDAWATAHQVDQEHVLSFDQTWIVFTPTMSDWQPEMNQPYLLQILWVSGGVWYRRSYYGVTWRTLTMESTETNQFLEQQVVRAQYLVTDSGTLSATGGGAIPAVAVPVADAGTPQWLSFFREDALIVDEYLLGFYTWASDMTLLNATVYANAPLGSPMVLGLEVNGVQTGQTLTIPVGAANTTVEASVPLSGTIPAGQLVRWQVLSGPDPADAADGCAVGMSVTMA